VVFLNIGGNGAQDAFAMEGGVGEEVLGQGATGGIKTGMLAPFAFDTELEDGTMGLFLFFV
jgi:hypothetical protein